MCEPCSLKTKRKKKLNNKLYFISTRETTAFHILLPTAKLHPLRDRHIYKTKLVFHSRWFTHNTYNIGDATGPHKIQVTNAKSLHLIITCKYPKND
jgi:hypothetical protein